MASAHVKQDLMCCLLDLDASFDGREHVEDPASAASTPVMRFTLRAGTAAAEGGRGGDSPRESHHCDACVRLDEDGGFRKGVAFISDAL